MPNTTITGTLLDAAGAPMLGYVTFTPDTPIVNVTPAGKTIPRASVRADLDSEGKFSVELQPADAAGVNPQNFTYRAALYVYSTGQRPARPTEFSFTAPAGETLDLADITPVTGNNGIPVVVGPAGPQGMVGPQGIAGPAGPQGIPGVVDDDGLKALIAAPASQTRVLLDGTYAGLASAESRLRDSKRQANSPFRGVSIANESAFPSLRFTGAQLVPAFNSVKRYIAVKDAAFVRFVFVNAYGRDQLTANPITVRAAITVGADTWPVFFGGARDVVIQPGAIVVSDPVAVSLLVGTAFYARTYVQSSGETPIHGGAENLTRGAWGEGCDAAYGVTAPDKSLSGVVTGSGASHYSPVLVVGGDGIGSAFVGVVGDSISAGLGDAESIVNAGRGFIRRAMNNVVPFVHIGISGENWAESRHYRRPLLAGCTDILCELGINDIVVSGRTLAQVQGYAIADWLFHDAAGARVWQTTLAPKTTSTDNWATTANQSVTAVEPIRIAFNNWIRAGAPINAGKQPVAVGTAGALLAGQPGHPLDGYFETADAVETSRNSGLWKVGYVMTSDNQGIHPNSTGHAAMAATVDVSRFA